jgi:hypothetical protein
MTTTARSIRLVQALAAVAVTLAAVAAVASAWMARQPQPAPPVQAQSPAAHQPIHVVKAPQREGRL